MLCLTVCQPWATLIADGDLPDQSERYLGDTIPTVNDEYRMFNGEAVVEFKGQVIREPVRDYAWKWSNLWHKNGTVLPIRRQ